MEMVKLQIHRGARKALHGHGHTRKVCSVLHLVHVQCDRPHHGRAPMFQHIGFGRAQLKVIHRLIQDH